VGLNELEGRIDKGIKRIEEAKAHDKRVPDWERHLKELKREYKEKLLVQTFNEIKEIYLPGMYQWIEDNEQELLNELQVIESELSISMVNENEEEKFKQCLKSFKEWHLKAIAAYKAKSETGGCTDMSITIDVQVPMPAGESEAVPSSVNTVDGKWGPRLHIILEDDEERTASLFCPTKATESNMLGKLLKAVFGKIQKVESDDLLGQRVKVLVEHVEKDDKTYANVIDFP